MPPTQSRKYRSIAKQRGSVSSTFSPRNSQDNGDFSEAFALLREEEGLRTEAYQDQTGKWTIGFGNTMINGRPVKPGDRITEQQAEQMMQDSVKNQYSSFKNKVQRPLTPSQTAALTSFEYNLGSGIWNQATDVIESINSGDFDTAGQLMQAYNKSKDPSSGQLKVNPVLARRREREAGLLQGTPSYGGTFAQATPTEGRKYQSIAKSRLSTAPAYS